MQRSPVALRWKLRRGIELSGPLLRGRLLAVAASSVILTVASALGVSASLALFSDPKAPTSDFGTQAVFPGERVTPAFVVSDTSGGGSAVDTSSEFAAPSDGRTVATGTWSTAFAANRYLEFDMNGSVPGGLANSSPVFRFRFASTGAAATTCIYLEVRSRASGSVLATYGSSVSPAACVTGTALTTSTVSIPVVDTSNRANDLRVRVLGRDSAAGGMTVDEARFTGANSYGAFSLYPVRYTDAADTTPTSLPWGLAGP
jgi:hypothetical protein